MITRSDPPFALARLRARNLREAVRAERELLAFDPPRPVPELEALRAAGNPAAALRAVADDALSRAYGSSPALAESRMGVAARRRAEERFDAAHTTRRLAEVLREARDSF